MLFIMQCTKLIKDKQSVIDALSFGSNLEEVRKDLNDHRFLQDSIRDLQLKVEQCFAKKVSQRKIIV